MESTLSLAKKDLEAEVGLYLGWGRGTHFEETEWTREQQNAITSIVKSGLRQFYFPPPLSGISYDWSFLKPTAIITLASGVQAAELPDDFGGLEGKITLHGDENHFWPLDVVGEGDLRRLYAGHADSTGRPEYAAVVPKKQVDREKGQRSELYIYPAPNAEYTARVQYYLLPNALDGSREYAYGGMAHAETILESCLAIAEQRLDDKAGVHSTKWMERLAASINHDRRLKQQVFGYNGDNSDALAHAHVFSRFRMDQVVTLAGQTP